MSKPTLSVIVPAFNEEKFIKKVADKINLVAPEFTKDYEIIIINDGSSDNTKKVAESVAKKDKRVKVISNETNRGMGYSYLRGLSEAKYEYCWINFADDAHPVDSLKAVLSRMGEADMVIPVYINFHITKTWFRHVLSITYTHILNSITGLQVGYYNGATLHKTALVKGISGLSGGFGFQAEMIIYLLKKGASFVEVGITNVENKKDSSAALRLSNIIKVMFSVGKLYYKYQLSPKLSNV